MLLSVERVFVVVDYGLAIFFPQSGVPSRRIAILVSPVVLCGPWMRGWGILLVLLPGGDRPSVLVS